MTVLKMAKMLLAMEWNGKRHERKEMSFQHWSIHNYFESKGSRRQRNEQTLYSFNVSEIFYCCPHELTAKELQGNLEESWQNS